MPSNWKSNDRDANVKANQNRQRDALHVQPSKETRDEVKRTLERMENLKEKKSG